MIRNCNVGWQIDHIIHTCNVPSEFKHNSHLCSCGAKYPETTFVDSITVELEAGKSYRIDVIL